MFGFNNSWNFKNLIYLALLFICNLCIGQKKSDLSQINETENPKHRIDSINDLGYSLWIKKPSHSVELGNKAYTLAEGTSYIEGAAYAKRISGVAHWALGEPRLALEDLYKSLDLYSSIKNKEGMANSKLNIGMVYADINEDSTALKFYKESINDFSLLKLNGRVGTVFTKIGSLQLKNGELNDALNNFLNALKIHTKNDFQYGMAEVHNRLGKLYIEKNNIEQADYHLRQSLILSQKIEDKDGTISSMIQYGRLQRLIKEYKISNIHLKWGLKEASSQQLNNYKLLALEYLADLKKEINQPDSALYYYQWYVTLKDSVYNVNKSKQIAALEFKNDLNKKEKELQYLTEKESTNQKIQWILFTAILIIIVLSIFLIKSLWQRNSDQRMLMEKERLLSTKQLENQRLKQAELEQKLELKNKELTSYALNFVQKNDFLDSMQLKIKELKKSSDIKQSKQLIELEKLIKLQNSKDKDWEDFRQHFEQVYSSFFTNLKTDFPNLSANDLKVAALTRLNLSIKEASNILGISPESTKTARYRLRKKMNLAPEDDLFDFLMRYDHKV